MIPYRRNRAIESGATSLLAADVTIGDVVLIRKPGELEMSALPVLGALNIPGQTMRLRFEDFTKEVSNDIPVGVESFTEGGWRQYDPLA